MIRTIRAPLFALTIVALCFAGSVHAQAATRATPCSPTTQTNEICITWAAVVTHTDGLPTMFPVTYRVEQQVGSAAFTTVETTSSLKSYVKNLAPGSYTFRVFAIENAIVSDASNTASKSIIQAPPNAPVIVIAATIRAGKAPVYRVVAMVTPAPNEVVFIAPESMRNLFASK